MKKILQNLFIFFGYSLIKKKNFEKLYRTLDQSIKYLINKDNPIIFDVGAHTGETIERFRKLYNKPIIHSFEPQVDSFQKLKKFSNEKTVLNNFALGEKSEIKKFYINKNDSTSGFYKFTDKMFTDHDNYNEDIQIKTLDEYVEERNVENIDILKIDVQGYEDNVLKGAIKTLKNKIKILELEIIFIDYYEKKSSFYNLESIIKPLGFELYTISSPVLDEPGDRLKWLDAIYISNKFFK